jgi:type VI secretion system protein ImpA
MMNVIDMEKLLKKIEPEHPCGENLSYNSSFLALKELLKPKPMGIVMAEKGDHHEEPNWRDICNKCLELFDISKDLSIAVWLCYSLLCIEGMTGLENGLLLIRKLVEQYWEDVHPRLGPDHQDCVKRINIIEWLSPRSVDSSNPIQFKRRLMEIPLTDSERIGRFCFRDIQTANSNVVSTRENEQKEPDRSVIEAAFNCTDSTYMTDLLRAAEQSIDHLGAIIQIFTNQTADEQSPDLSDLQEILQKICNTLNEYLEKKHSNETVLEEYDNPNGEIHPDGAGNPSRPSDEIRSHKEVLYTLERLIKYFEQYEPSNPAPLLLERAKRLASKNFVEIIEDMCPDAMDQIRKISGIEATDQA